MNFNDIARSIAIHVQPYLPMGFTAIDVYCEYKAKPPIRCFAVIKGKSEPAPMWSSDMIKNLKVDFDNYKRISTVDVVKVHYHVDLNGDFYFKYDFKK